eukprot:gene17024-20281_t
MANALLDFVVLDSFVALPLPISNINENNKTTVIFTGEFYQLEDSGYKCKRSPCPSMRATLINTDTSYAIVDWKDPYYDSVGQFFDQTWYFNKLLTEEKPRRSLLQGSVTDDSVIAITRTFVRVPDPAKQCPPIAKPKCKEGHLPVYVRNANRCLVFDDCKVPGACVKSLSVCPAGYRLFSHPAGDKVCPQHYCDADFLETTKVV